MSQIYSFVYLDEENIDLLYPQIFDDVIEKTVSQTSEGKTNAAIKGELFGILSSNLDNEEKLITSESFKINTSISKKAQRLIEHLKDEHDEIDDIIESKKIIDKSFMFVGRNTFFLSDIYDKENGLSLFDKVERNGENLRIDHNSVFILESGNTSFIKQYSTQYIESDDYYELNNSKQKSNGIMMYLSNSKMKKDIRHLTNKIKRAKHFNFFVFGQLIKLGNNFYKIVPFAIWI